MKRKGWLPPILVFLIFLICLVWYQNSQHATSLASTSNMPQLPWSKQISDITKVKVTLSDKSIFTNRSQNNWLIYDPLVTSANTSYIYDVISLFVKPAFNKTVETNIQDPGKYGIDSFSKSIVLYDTAKNEYEIICGKEADSLSYYVYVPKAHCVYTMNKKAFDTISLNLSDWRDKNYLYFNPDNTSKIVIGAKSTLHTILRTSIDNKTSFTSDTMSLQDIEKVILFLKTTKVQDFIIDDASLHIIEAYQLDKPIIRLTIYSNDGKLTTLSISSTQSSDKVYYAMLNGSNTIFTIPYFVVNFQKEP